MSIIEVNMCVDFVGAPSNDPQEFEPLNQKPAHVMRAVAEKKNAKAMGFIGGILGPKKFTTVKKKLIKYLQSSSVPLAYVEPTLVYGAGRKDKMTRNVPLLKFLGIFSAKFKPVLVGDVVEELQQKLIKFS
ncbi:NAD(P)-dependent oxidoreductase [Limosilactobacillus reuteri]|uniref:NAD(P)-dependent oxidoreductase n=1 Tax=Limosilactobacillus reuteri TaxID=1598 RepID=UPI001E37D265|nr:NAD(P)-dependent oxidoreductase [Limosilactobacillus reuteri]MCC4397489.1 NAD(P)-dependent oxidoreductase [Limosilactobacillus reuteri]MCC4400147.1 NAD(P)-dependent oxidoreductase [Limosilactobacillus reuteri]MCC4403563.1 NAD(P)-dependent oxidoreductase [Limosilactobacillus reuteri]MCC4408884.1 NAD(P)-dependent oxidoreductase [Limosilactobacillus reuteri]MCC4411980.1 NAD(P)-dependent oxidoreductase [Limosilactobacillus reuteri]